MTTKDRGRPFRVLQLTDPHLMAEASGELLGVNTRASLDAVIDRALSVHGQPDLVLATGDLAQDGTEEAYRAFGDRMQVFEAGSAWLAGNHDDSGVLQRVASEYQGDRRQVIGGGWQCLLLDSSVHGQVYGELAPSQLAFLEQSLAAHADLPALIALHHHPVDVGCDWMEPIGLRNRDQFWRIIERFPQVRIVLWGHIHQEQDLERKGVRLMATPSTCIQFTAGSRKFSVEPLSPGYRWLELQPDGTFQTEVERASDFEFELDQKSSGY